MLIFYLTLYPILSFYLILTTKTIPNWTIDVDNIKEKVNKAGGILVKSEIIEEENLASEAFLKNAFFFFSLTHQRNTNSFIFWLLFSPFAIRSLNFGTLVRTHFVFGVHPNPKTLCARFESNRIYLSIVDHLIDSLTH
ncbi:hypothetical protein RIF29_37338 [Crotalaria pallida]|uniref:Uncharacterized protein n=1 Tax=Crotalaria pallida TaxID=3830 RepID=A0AAN9EIV7_CROPI